MILRCSVDDDHTEFYQLGTATYQAEFTLEGEFIDHVEDSSIKYELTGQYRCQECLSTAVQVIEETP